MKMKTFGMTVLIIFSVLVWLAVIGDIIYYLLFSGTGTL